jgi:hypothetical protein
MDFPQQGSRLTFPFGTATTRTPGMGPSFTVS